jgi:hypothetical protein
MSDDLLKQDEDVEAHKHKFGANDESESDDVEAHKHKFGANDETGSDDSDDVEGHRLMAN